jgi:hypothetical protein
MFITFLPVSCVIDKQIRIVIYEIQKQEEKKKEKQQFFLYCQEHPYELSCIGTSEISQNLLCIVMFLLCLFFVIRK